MSTNQRATLTALNGRYLNTNTNKINESYLNDALQLLIANTRALYDACHQKPRRKATAIAWDALAWLANDALKDDIYPARCHLVASSDHLKKWLTEYGRGYETIAETVAWVEAEQRGEHA